MQKYFAGELRPDQRESWKAEDGIFYLVSGVDAALAENEKKYQILSDYHKVCFTQDREQIAALTTENKRLRQIVIDCYVGWPDEVLQKTLRGEEEKP